MCPSTFLYASTCSAHERTHHTNCAYKCEMCNRTFSQKYNLERHMKLHKGGKVYRCAICERSFCNQERLDTHTKSCTELHRCTVCGKGYREKAQLEAHIAKQHDLTSESSEEDGESADCAADSSFDQERTDDESGSDDDVTASNGTLGTDREQTGPAWSCSPANAWHHKAPQSSCGTPPVQLQEWCGVLAKTALQQYKRCCFTIPEARHWTTWGRRSQRRH
ncbi:hypothetical protein HPB50_004008 [Hyalomma asiaticum]|uniref:Uncharacterized protein n=1 Tax=Hyalomma asiaticum TaxID=266040 RepID=A0ACB7RU81_HYAAI|nr:hypothetical protein HPB50_004008 [Hyalomma asiaticum]